MPVPFQYDSTPPSLRASTTTSDQDVTVNWQTSAELSALTITRSPGVRGEGDSVVDRGRGDGTFNDTRVTNGVDYRYTITAIDQAGNVTTRVLRATPGPRLLSPVGGVEITSPPVLAWTAIRGASYYNVQIYRDGQKVLSVWPSHPELGLTRSWKFDDHRFHLRPGRYRWYVWPGFGARSAARYGQKVGSGRFVML
jgi:hypothetical protein